MGELSLIGSCPQNKNRLQFGSKETFLMWVEKEGKRDQERGVRVEKIGMKGEGSF